MSILSKTLLVFIAVIIEAIPVMANKLKRFDPNIAPNTKPICPLKAATIELTTSGMDVPNATTVNPMIVSDTPNELAVITAPLTKTWAPIIIPTTPTVENKIDFLKPRFFSMSSVSIFLKPFDASYSISAK